MNMMHTTRGVVLRTVRHSDHSYVVRALTESLGVRSLLVRTGKKNGSGVAALQPLCRVEIVAIGATDREMLNVRELRVERPYRQVVHDPVRGTVLLFVQEVLVKVLRGEAADGGVYAFVEAVLEALDTVPDVRHFPLVFLVRLANELGFMPAPPRSGEVYFDLREGVFVPVGGGDVLGPPHSGHLATLLQTDFDDMHALVIGATHRRELLDRLLLYLRFHVEGLGELRSPAVLQQVLG